MVINNPFLIKNLGEELKILNQKLQNSGSHEDESDYDKAITKLIERLREIINLQELRAVFKQTLQNRGIKPTAPVLSKLYLSQRLQWQNKELRSKFEWKTLSVNEKESINDSFKKGYDSAFRNQFKKFEKFLNGKSDLREAESLFFICFNYNLPLEQIINIPNPRIHSGNNQTLEESNAIINVLVENSDATSPQKNLKAESVKINDKQGNCKKFWLLICSLISGFIIILIAIAFFWFNGNKKEEPFNVGKYYTLSGKIGDIGDLGDISQTSEMISFTYSPRGKGPHEWEWKYVDNGNLSVNTCKFAGYAFLDPPGNFGERSGGKDLSGFDQTITIEARCPDHDTVWLTCSIGGVTWNWDKGKKVSARYPETLEQAQLAIIPLMKSWKAFSFEIPKSSESSLKNVKCPLAVSLSWDNNKKYIQTDSSGKVIHSENFTIQLRNIFYHSRK